MKVTVTDAAGNITSHQFTEGEQPHSIEVSRNTKGEYSFSVKTYFPDGGEAEALARQEAIHAHLSAHFKADKGGT